MAGISDNELNLTDAEDDCHLLRREDLLVEPFQPVTYNIERVGRLEDVIAPPYDVMTPQEREKYARSHPFNIVHILLPRQACEEIKRTNEDYEMAGAIARRWLSEGILVLSQKPFVYPYRQLFKDDNGNTVEQWSIIVAMQLREYSTRVVRPHEMTTKASKLDRLMLLRATRLEMGQVYALFVDEDKDIDELLLSGTSRGEPWLSVMDDKGILHSIWRIDDIVWLSELQSALQDSWVLIADGHHRYETAIAYMRERWRYEGGLSEGHPACYIGVALANLYGQITILPTHRLLHFSSPNERDRFVRWLINTFWQNGYAERMSVQDALLRFQQLTDGEGVVNFVISYGNETLLLRASTHELVKLCPGEMIGRSELINAGVNTVVLHELILPMARHSIGAIDEPLLSYTQDVTEALKAASSDERSVAILLRPIVITQLRLAAELGERLPPKSTYFYPKVPSGLVMRLL
ncbi:MAG: DUF1015 domain-containing protein [Armatimonadota bacterium]|nr:DUF1015 domain-containing protein [Armatimonadota bacterium]MCX7778465.1 DUF1015 domain-containing protein [Armatimonadota bacterium]MDW8026044.1 DUF1015 domain-containing protein [Armatimonadota bacterium]